MNAENKTECDQEGCTCTVSPEIAIQKDDKTYCSQGCAEGSGCQHPDCACAAPA